MQLVDRIEKRRFVGREFLLWLWFESEIFEGTLSAGGHGEFGMWIERQLVLSAGNEVTRIKGSSPAAAREAKESLLLGKLPEIAGFHVSIGEREARFVLKAERMALSGLAIQAILGADEDEPAQPALAAPPRRPRKKHQSVAAEAEEASDEAHEAFYERMHLTREIEALIEALYADFLALRLAPAWAADVAPAMRAWALGRRVDADAYRTATERARGGAARRKLAG